MKDALDGKVKAVVLSKRLKSHPVCLSNEGMLSIEMEKVLNAMPNDQKVRPSACWKSTLPTRSFEKLSKLYAEESGEAENLRTAALYASGADRGYAGGGPGGVLECGVRADGVK